MEVWATALCDFEDLSPKYCVFRHFQACFNC